MFSVNDPLYGLFIEDLNTQLGDMMDNLVVLTKDNSNEDAKTRLLRALHSLKGIFYTVELKVHGDVFHLVESLIKSVDSPFVAIPQLSGLLFDLHTELECFLSEIEQDSTAIYEFEQIKTRVESLIESMTKRSQPQRVPEYALDEPPRQALYSVLKATELKYLELIDQKGRPEEIEALLEGLVQCSHVADQLGEPRLIHLFDGACRLITDYVQYRGVLDHIAEGLIVESFDWAAKLMSPLSKMGEEEERNLQVHIDMLQPQRLKYLRQLTDEPLTSVNAQGKRLGEILVEQGKIDQSALEAVMHNKKAGQRIGAALLTETALNIKDLTSALNIQEQQKTYVEPYTYVRVPEQKVDVLVDGMEELMILQSELKEKLRKRWIESDLATSKHLDQIDRMLIMLQHQATSFRMTTLEHAFKKAELVGRNTAKDLLKEVSIDVSGFDVEADRSVVERLQNPIMHLVRNAVYHGIEPVSVREMKGKQRAGKLVISAWTDERELAIQVSDDGRGLDLDRIVDQAKTLGLASLQKPYSEWEIMNFIFEPGFSTNEEADAIAGRGIGMNVVESEVKSLGGHIEIQNRPQQGVSFVLKVPIHTSQLEGLLVRIAHEKIIIPLEDVVGLYKPEHVEEITVTEVGMSVKLEGVIYPVSLFNHMLLKGDVTDIKEADELLLIHSGQGRQIIPIDEYIQTLTVYVNPMNHLLDHHSLFKGVAVINEREFALILDSASTSIATNLFEEMS